MVSHVASDVARGRHNRDVMLYKKHLRAPLKGEVPTLAVLPQGLLQAAAPERSPAHGWLFVQVCCGAVLDREDQADGHAEDALHGSRGCGDEMVVQTVCVLTQI